MAYPTDTSLNVIVTWTVEATDNSDESPTITCNPAQPALLPVGDNIINCVATDTAGNQASCNFEVSVRGMYIVHCTIPTSLLVTGKGQSNKVL